MGFFDNWRKPKAKKKYVKTIKIQASSPEASANSVIIESMLTGRTVNISIPGTTNAFTNYESQVSETYRKYNSQADFGCQQTRAIIDLRTAFIGGEGVSVSCSNEQTAKWIEEFITINELDSDNFINAVKGSEMAGQSLFVFKKQFFDKIQKEHIKVSRIPYTIGKHYKPVYQDQLLKEKVIDMVHKSEFGWQSFGFKDFIYTRIGGDDANNYGPVTKTGTVLTDLENYDRALKDMRRTNHIFARITPVFETETDSETSTLKTWLTSVKWTIGKAFIGKAKFRYETPKTSTHENLISEMTSTIKTISSTTGVPVHWLGYVDLMSNRATADSLYEFIKNATVIERTTWSGSLYKLILKAQELYIDNGFKGLTFNPDFQVRLPLISFENFLDKVRALNIALADEGISIDDYRNAIPGIDPLKTAKAIEEKKKEDEKNAFSMGAIDASVNINNPGNPGNKEEEK